MSALLFASNIGQVIVVLSNYKLSPGMHSKTSHGQFWITIQSLAGMLRDGCFNFAYWLFAFTYLNSAISMPYLFKQIEIPEKTERNKSLLFWGMAAFNELFIFVYCLVIYIDNTKNYSNGGSLSPRQLYEYIALKYSVGILQLISAVFLIAALVIIRKFLLANGVG